MLMQMTNVVNTVAPLQQSILSPMSTTALAVLECACVKGTPVCERAHIEYQSCLYIISLTVMQERSNIFGMLTESSDVLTHSPDLEGVPVTFLHGNHCLSSQQ